MRQPSPGCGARADVLFAESLAPRGQELRAGIRPCRPAATCSPEDGTVLPRHQPGCHQATVLPAKTRA
jgi:hypothetical protein